MSSDRKDKPLAAASEGTAVTVVTADEVKKKNRRGKGSKAKHAETFRSKKNEEFKKEHDAKIENYIVSLGYTPTEVFGLRQTSAIVHPQIELKIDTDITGSICNNVSEVLHSACKISPSIHDGVEDPCTYDAETLMWVSALQIEAKLFYARSGTQFLPDMTTAARVRNTTVLFPNALAPLAILLDQIGRFSFGEQMFVPSNCGIHDFAYGQILSGELNQSRLFFSIYVERDPGGLPTGRVDLNGNEVRAIVRDEVVARERGILHEGALSVEFLANPQNYQWYGVLEFAVRVRPPALPTIAQIAERYADLASRVNKKLTNAFVDVNLTKGSGQESQLVYGRKVDEQVYEVWSPRALRQDSLNFGAVFHLGFDGDPNKGFPCVETTCNVSAAISCLAGILAKKIR